jgi:RNA polymerase sigma-70 factor (ECF subfamily)
MRTAIVNHVRSELRRKHNRRRLAVRLRAEQPTTATASYPSDLADLMHLRPVERAVLYLHDIEGMPFDEVAEATGIAVGHARVTASRARRRLRTLLEEEA